MEYKIDVDRLRDDMKNYYGTAMFNVSPVAVMDLARVEQASDQEIIEMAQKNRVNLEDYMKEGYI